MGFRVSSCLYLIVAALAVLLTAPDGARGQSKSGANVGQPAEPKPGWHWHPDQVRNWIAMLPSNDAQIVIPVTINGHTLRALVDTGAPTPVIDRAAARRIGLAVNDTRTTDSPEWFLGKAHFSTSGFGAFTYVNGDINVGDLSAFNTFMTHPVDMVLGVSAISGFALQVDFDHRRIAFLRSGTEPLDGLDGKRVSIVFKPHERRLLIPLLVSGERFRAMVIDTGNDGVVQIVKAAWRKVRKIPARATSIMGFSMTGSSSANPLFIADSVVLGSQPVKDVPVKLVNHPLAGGTNGLVGADLLRRFNFLIDARAGKMILAKRKTPLGPFDITMSGIQGLTTDTGLKIMHVMAHSPAEKLGLKEGDRICRVDGAQVQADWVGTPKDGWGHGPEGKAVSLKLCDGRRMTLTLHRFY